ncbi:effector-associated constant component EACC1 [Streptomyces sp. cg40]|uniref:effector-associated constant component EACC1 n=1 Tax=Streptomyces sp. cg40 TaxID=3419764 RepID=UPI003CFBD6C8
MDVVLGLTPDGDADAEEVERLASRLRGELRGLDLDALRPFAGDVSPEGAKAVDPVTVGAVVLALSASGGVLPALVETLRDWLGRQSARHRVSVTIDGDTIELEWASADERRELVEAFVRRHGTDTE